MEPSMMRALIHTHVFQISYYGVSVAVVNVILQRTGTLV